MTRKDFQLIATAIQTWTPQGAWCTDNDEEIEKIRKSMAKNMAEALTQTNPDFDWDRFMKACRNG